MPEVTGSHPQDTTGNVPLTLAALGQEVELLRVQGGRRLTARLATMGLVSGIRFIVEAGGKAGPLLILLGDARLILGHGLAEQMIVHPVGDKQPWLMC